MSSGLFQHIALVHICIGSCQTPLMYYRMFLSEVTSHFRIVVKCESCTVPNVLNHGGVWKPPLFTIQGPFQVSRTFVIGTFRNKNALNRTNQGLAGFCRPIPVTFGRLLQQSSKLGANLTHQSNEATICCFNMSRQHALKSCRSNKSFIYSSNFMKLDLPRTVGTKLNAIIRVFLGN